MCILSISINSLQCVPACVNECGTLPAGTGITVSNLFADPATCTFTSTATCDTGTMIEIALTNGMNIQVTSPQTFTCTTGPSWLYNNNDEVSGLLQCT
uniref:C6 domain-containing protein n=1 Tax=Panagrolaimus sp. PS1159 TaxID=55785 RepID=A0AC35F081_9BILA